jgi:Holliday junction resolvase RusA-like endonuclease
MPLYRIDLDLPLPPSINSAHDIAPMRPRRASGKSLTDWESWLDGKIAHQPRDAKIAVFRSKTYERWRKESQLEIIAARPRLEIRELPFGMHYCARMRWNAKAAPDVDNPIKPCLDLLHSMRITPDDRMCWHVSAGRSWHVAPGRAHVRVWSITPPEGMA